MKFSLMNLPYNPSDLEPYISARTMDFHHQKHHRTYVDNLNKLNGALAEPYSTLGEAIRSSFSSGDKAIFNNAGQVWNHDFYWHSMAPKGGGMPTGKLLQRIQEDFGSFEKFRDSFIAEGLAQFGSGWVWLVVEEDTGKLRIVKTANAESPLLTPKLRPILTSDVWEHAYYLDYQNARVKYLETFLNHLANWRFAAELFELGENSIIGS